MWSSWTDELRRQAGVSRSSQTTPSAPLARETDLGAMRDDLNSVVLRNTPPENNETGTFQSGRKLHASLLRASIGHKVRCTSSDLEKRSSDCAHACKTPFTRRPSPSDMEVIGANGTRSTSRGVDSEAESQTRIATHCPGLQAERKNMKGHEQWLSIFLLVSHLVDTNSVGQ